MRDPGEKADTTLAGAARQSSEASRQVMPLNHPGRGKFRVTQVVAALAFLVLVVGTVGFTDRRTLLALVTAAVIIAAVLPGGNVTAVATTALGTLFVVGGLLQLAVLDTSLNFTNATVLNVCAVLGLGLIVAGCGLYEFETDDHGRIVRRTRATASRDVRDRDVRRGQGTAD